MSRGTWRTAVAVLASAAAAVPARAGLDALKTRGPQNHGDSYQVALTESAHGKLSFGDLTILFQFVTEPPRQPKPMLPPSVSHSWRPAGSRAPQCRPVDTRVSCPSPASRFPTPWSCRM